MKSYTDIEQSRKLAEILPLESADMYYPYDLDSRKVLSIPIVKDDYCMPCINCWSLAALLGVLPNYKLSNEHNKHTCSVELFYGEETVSWFDNPIDACYEMIIKLNELNLL